MRNQILGWLAVTLSTTFSCLWSFWGIVENFHEGWYYPSLSENLGMMFVQYLSPMFGFLLITAISISNRRIGSILHLVAAAVVFWYFGGSKLPAAFLLLATPLFLLGLFYWFGTFEPKRWAYRIAIGLPLLTLLTGVPSAFRVAQRVDDGDLGERLVRGNGVNLVWAGQGPGYPERGGLSWNQAASQCLHLALDGRTVSDEQLNVWRLPSVEESVRSMALHGQNSSGVWDPKISAASYGQTPDKESPLWNVHSQVIYRWTGTEVDERSAFMIAYDGKVWPRDKRFAPDYFSFRCVRDP